MCKTAFKKFEMIWSVKTDCINSNFLKAVFHKFYLFHSWILCLTCFVVFYPNCFWTNILRDNLIVLTRCSKFSIGYVRLATEIGMKGSCSCRCCFFKLLTNYQNEASLSLTSRCTAQKMKFFIKNFFSKCDQIFRIWSHLLKKFLMGNFIFCTVMLLCKVCIQIAWIGSASLF